MEHKRGGGARAAGLPAEKTTIVCEASGSMGRADQTRELAKEASAGRLANWGRAAQAWIFFFVKGALVDETNANVCIDALI